MTSPNTLSRLERVELRNIWKNEARDFTPWLANEENLNILGDALGLQLELIETEQTVGSYSADIVCDDVLNERKVLIENQLEKTDHSHLGQIFTYAAGIDAVTIIWIAKQFAEEHRAAVDWLNHISGDELQFFAIEIQLWRIGDSPVAPRFNIVAKPNDWVREVKKARASNRELTEGQKLQLELWTNFKDYLESKSDIPISSPSPKYWIIHPWLRGMHFASIATYWNSESNSWDEEVRAEFCMRGQLAEERFRKLQEHEEEIEQSFGKPLLWHEGDNRKFRKIFIRRAWDFSDKDTWPDLFKWYERNIQTLKAALEPIVSKF